MKTPIAAFMEWLDSLPESHAGYLAHLYRISTTEDTADLAMTPEESLVRFRHYVVRQDFPLRVVARMVMIRGMMDLIFMTRETLVSQNTGVPFDTGSPDNVVLLSEKQWGNVLDSWKRLRSKEMSDSYLFSWARYVFSKQ
jgi:hypothetical protein